DFLATYSTEFRRTICLRATSAGRRQYQPLPSKKKRAQSIHARVFQFSMLEYFYHVLDLVCITRGGHYGHRSQCITHVYPLSHLSSCEEKNGCSNWLYLPGLLLA